MTLGQAQNLVIGLDNESQSWSNIDGEDCVMMNSTVDAVISGSTIAPAFKRSVAKLTLDITGVAANIEIVSVRLRKVATSVHVFENDFGTTLGTAIYPVGGTSVSYPYATIITPTAASKFSWYVPRNNQGIVTASTAVADRPKFAPVNATYFEVAVKNTALATSGIFRVYPGANITNDFNINPNTHYAVKLNITGVGTSSSTDSRVEYFGDVDYTADTKAQKSNSFILNPPPSGERRYRIPITQVDRYWSNTAANTPNEGYGLMAKAIGASGVWSVKMGWSDSQAVFGTASNVVRLTVAGGTGIEGFFELTVPAGVPAGNFTVQIVNTAAQAVVLWSWHFWVTPYNPNAYTVTPQPGVYTYPVPGGQVERYAVNTLWTTGLYKDKFMMDRSLGAVETYTTKAMASTDRGIIHYQFGRKDPFSSVVADGEMTYVTENYGTVAISESVMNPNKFLNSTYSGNWANEATGTTYLWNDPATLNLTSGNKSIYDPCPVGWRLPVSGTWSDFAQSRSTNNPTRDLGWNFGRGIGSAYASIGGLRYWPGAATDPVAGRIWYAPTGYRDGTSGTDLIAVGSSVYIHSSTPNTNAAQSLGLYVNSGATNANNTLTRYSGIAVRCIQE